MDAAAAPAAALPAAFALDPLGAASEDGGSSASTSYATSPPAIERYLGPKSPRLMPSGAAFRPAEPQAQRVRPGYFDLQRLAQQAELAEPHRHASVSSTASASGSSTRRLSPSQSSTSLFGDADESDDSDDTVEDALPSLRAKVRPSRASSRAGTVAGSVRARPPSRTSMRSPPPFAPADASGLDVRLFAQRRAQAPRSVIGDEDALEVNEREARLQLLSSLHLLGAADLERVSATADTAALPESDSRELATPRLGTGVEASDGIESGRASALSLAGPDPAKSRLALVSELSAALSDALEASQEHAASMEALRRQQVSALNSQQKRHDAREAALRAILKEVGVSEARVTRALLSATSQADVPVFPAEGRRPSPPPVRSPLTSAGKGGPSRTAGINARVLDEVRDDTTEALLLPHSLQEAMQEDFGEAFAPPTRASSQEGDFNTLRAKVDSRMPRDASPSKASMRTARSVKSTGSASARSNANASGPSSPAGARRDALISEAARASEEYAAESGFSTSAPSSSSATSSRSQNASFAWGLWGASGASAKKGALSVPAVSPSAVADGYLSDGGGPVTPAATDVSAGRQHGRSMSVSGTALSAAIVNAKEPPRGMMSAFSLGSLAWRRKPKAQRYREAQPDEGKNTIRGRPIGDVGDDSNDTLPARPTPARSPSNILPAAPLAGQTDTSSVLRDVKSAPHLEASVNSRDLLLELHEAIGSAPSSPVTERLQAQLMAQSQAAAPTDLPKPTHFRAILLATRIFNPTQSSNLLLDSGKRTSIVIADLALRLVGTAQEQGKVLEADRAPTTLVIPASGAASSDKLPELDTNSAPASAASATRAAPGKQTLAAARRSPDLPRPHGEQATRTARKKAPQPDLTEPNVTRLPDFFRFSPANANDVAVQPRRPSTDDAAARLPAPPVELEPIVPNDVKPPSLAIFARRANVVLPQSNRRRTKTAGTTASSESDETSGDEFEVYGGKGLARPEPPQPVSAREEDATRLLTDRYGFVYDATPGDVRLLRQARRAATPAPACLTGIRVGVRARGGTDSQSEEEKDAAASQESDLDLEQDLSPVGDDAEDGSLQAELDATSVASASTSSRKTAGGVFSIAPPKPVTSALPLSVPSQPSGESGPTSPSQERDFQFQSEGARAANGAGDEAPPPRSPRKPPSASQTVRRLLGQLQKMHETQQHEVQAEWDDFLRRRWQSPKARGQKKAAQPVTEHSSPATSLAAGQGNGRALHPNGKTADSDTPEAAWDQGLVGVSRLGDTKTGKEHWKEFLRLCQAGIPLCYRAKVWAECSGAIEAAEPGRYQELLAEHEGESNQCTEQIDLDVHRTMPTNVYFGGEGPGVPKLRRLLVAFSWYNPACGYCQGASAALSLARTC
jgi:hypothetical protein